MITHCLNCGSPHSQNEYPKRCACGHDMYENPIPVVVVLVPVKNKGILIQKRGIAPKIGEFCLVSGYLNKGELPEVCAKREALEECGVVLNQVQFLGFEYGDSQKNLLMVYLSNEINELDIHFMPNEEVTEIGFTSIPVELAFRVHTEYLEKYFKNQFKT